MERGPIKIFILLAVIGLAAFLNQTRPTQQRLAKSIQASLPKSPAPQITAKPTVATELRPIPQTREKSQDDRFSEVFAMSEQAPRFQSELKAIALSPPDSETIPALQIQAMLGLETIHDVQAFNEIQYSQKNPLLLKLARLGVKGARSGQPLIQKYIDVQMSEILNETN